MNYITRTKEFKKYEAAFGSTFAAIKYVSLLARKRCDEVHHCITESQALAWVVTGQEPISVIQYKLDAAKRIERAKHYVDDRISYIDDIEIREAVKHSINESKRSGHLIYCYNNIWELNKQARVRIISNIVWDEWYQLNSNS